MNKQNRIEIRALIKTLETARADLTSIAENVDCNPVAAEDAFKNEVPRISVVLSDIQDNIENQRDDEQEKFDSMSEGLQQGDTGQAIEAAVEALTDASDALREIIDELGTPVEDWNYYSAYVGDVVDTTLQDVFDCLEEAINN